jgi:hypothetical protein
MTGRRAPRDHSGVTSSPRKYTDAERRDQLEELARLCAAMAEALREHGETWPAGMYQERADLAERLLATGLDQGSLTELGARFPTAPHWLNAKAVDFGLAREPWQDEVAALHALASRLAMEVRATATLG